MELRFNLDPETDQPHIYGHGVTEEEVRQVMVKRGQVLSGDRGTRMKLGQTEAGRYLQIIYTADRETDSAFIITAFELRGKALRGYRRWKRRKPR